MEFIDKTGHIFSIKSYEQEPIGYIYNETDYIFWINDSEKFSIGNYYIKPIRFVLRNDEYVISDNLKLEINIESNIYSLIGSKHIEGMLEQSDNVFDYINLYSDGKWYWDGEHYSTITSVQKDNYVVFESILKKTLTEDDLIVIENLTNNEGSNYNMVTLYICCKSDDIGTFLSNLLITISRKEHDEWIPCEYCPLTIGSEYIDECEELIINGKNMGIELPKDIIRAVFDVSFYNDECNTTVYNKKLKELLFNYMNIKGECGNFKSAINSLKWFGWGNKITISKLLQTDNEFINQYVLDYFDIKNDNLQSYKYFRNAALIKLNVAGNEISDEENLIDFNEHFWGEGNPKLTDLFKTLIETKYDEEDITFYSPYYKYLFNELGLKLSLLEHYYKKYFLPLHLYVHSTSISYKCFMNDNKIIIANNKQIITEQPQYLSETGYKTIVNIEFPSKTNHLLFYNQKHYIDDNFNEFNYYLINPEELEEQLYKVNETCISIPINFNIKDYVDNTFVSRTIQYYNCNLILCDYTNDKVFETQFSFIQDLNNVDTFYKNLVIIPRLFKDKKYQSLNYWLNKEIKLYLCVNGEWFYYSTVLKMPKLNIQLGKLQYKYYDEEILDETSILKYPKFKQLSELTDDSIKFNLFMWEPQFVTVNNIDFFNNENVTNDFLNKYKETFNINNSPNLLNRIHMFDIYDENLNKLEYNIPEGLTETEYNISIYNQFFNQDNLDVKYYNNILQDDFDMYLMHTNNEQLKQYWYVVYISKNTLNTLYNSQLNYKNNFIFNYNTSDVLTDIKDINDEILKNIYYSADNKIDIGRLLFEYKNETYSEGVINYDSVINKIYLRNNNEDSDIDINYYWNSEDTMYSINNLEELDTENDIKATSLNNFRWNVNSNNNYKLIYTIDTDKNVIYYDDNISYKKSNRFKFEYIKSDNKFLINRMFINYVNGENHFNNNDTIVATLKNNNGLYFKLNYGSKWKFTPNSLLMDKVKNVSSTTETTIISLNNGNIRYNKGYYNVECVYSLDANIQHTYTAKSKILIV